MTRAKAALTVSSSRHVSPDRAKKAAQFFELYPKGPPPWLLALCVVPENNPLTVNHIRTVLWLKTPAERKDFLDRAVKQDWSARRLELEIKTTGDSESSHGGGPPIKAPQELFETLQQVLVCGDMWLKRYDAIWSHDEFWSPKLPYDPAESEILFERLKKAHQRVALLKAGAETLGKRLERLKRKLKRASSD